MATPTELFIADELPRRPYTNEFPFVAGKTLVTTGVGLEVVAGDAPGEYIDNVFRIKDNDDATKKIAFEASGVGTGTTKTITMPNADVNLGKVPNSLGYTPSTGVLDLGTTDAVGLNASLADSVLYSQVLTVATAVTIAATTSSRRYALAYTTGTSTFNISAVPTSSFYLEIEHAGNTQSPLAVTLTSTADDLWLGDNSDDIYGTTTATINLFFGEIVRVSRVTATGARFGEGKGWQITRSRKILHGGILASKNGTNMVQLGHSGGSSFTTNSSVTFPSANVNLGDLPSVATTNTNSLTNATARILGGSGGTASKPNATIINGVSCTANGGMGVILTGNNVTTTLGGAVVQGNYKATYANQAAVKQCVIIIGQTTANVLTELTNCGSGGGVTTAGDTKYILATKPNGMSNTNGVGIHRITLTGSNQTSGATYFGFSGEYIVTCSYNGTTTVIDAITTVHTSLRAGVAETFTPSFTLDATTANAALLIGVTTTLDSVRCAGHVESVYS